jgi:hypothetical protein
MKNRPPPHTPPWALRERAQKVLHTPSSSLPKPKDATDAFRVLFELASSPDTAGDALALLHELQVHQVELDMQTEELVHSRAELETAWADLHQWHEASPSAQLLFDADGRLLECNAMALNNLNQTLEEVRGKRLSTWLSSRDVQAAENWLAMASPHTPSHAALNASSHSSSNTPSYTASYVMPYTAPVSISLTLCPPRSATCHVLATARKNPTAPGMLVAWIEMPRAMQDSILRG